MLKTGIIGSITVQIRETKNIQDLTDVKIVFVQDRRSKNWLALLSTDLELSEEEIVRIYGKRWDIEVFFKVCKSYLALAKEYQGRNYDAQVAATSIVFLRYIMLAVESRNTQDDRTIGELFYYYSDEMEDLKLSQALVLLIDTLRRVLSNFPVISQELANMIMDTFLSTIPRSFKERLLFAT
ncbi:transposase [Dehalobacter restrictus]|uniref:transposase n=1 Tax=Dehalobacter restrictus TaxID=55583 RepID=UPI0006847A82|nr:transposase [Dehalobacter restrictus]